MCILSRHLQGIQAEALGLQATALVPRDVQNSQVFGVNIPRSDFFYLSRQMHILIYMYSILFNYYILLACFTTFDLKTFL